MIDMEYFRIKVKVQNGTRSAWVVRTREKNDFQFFRVVNKDGDEPNNPETIIASKRDIIYQKPAAFNNKYAELEIKESDMNKHNNLIDVLNGHLTKASGAKKVTEKNLKEYAEGSVLDFIPGLSSTDNKFVALHEFLEEKDPTAATLLRDVMDELRTRLEDANLVEAVNRLAQSISQGSTMQASGHRNNLAKAAHALGMQTPISY